jgi:Phage integrase family
MRKTVMGRRSSAAIFVNSQDTAGGLPGLSKSCYKECACATACKVSGFLPKRNIAYGSIGPLSRGAIWFAVSRRLRERAPMLRHFGPHSLRHACATRLINQGLSLKEVGDHLGQRDPDATRIYAKVNLVRPVRWLPSTWESCYETYRGLPTVCSFPKDSWRALCSQWALCQGLLSGDGTRY